MEKTHIQTIRTNERTKKKIPTTTTTSKWNETKPKLTFTINWTKLMVGFGVCICGVLPTMGIMSFLAFSFSEASRRFMMRTCNGLELRDQIPPLPPEVALSNFDSSLLLDHHIMNVCERWVRFSFAQFYYIFLSLIYSFIQNTLTHTHMHRYNAHVLFSFGVNTTKINPFWIQLNWTQLKLWLLHIV